MFEQQPLRDGKQLVHCLPDLTQTQFRHFPPALQRQQTVILEPGTRLLPVLYYTYYTSSLLRLRHHRRLYAKDQVRKILAKFLVPSSYSGNEANSDEDVFATGAALGKAEKGLCVSALARSVLCGCSLSYSISRPISLPSGSLHCSIYIHTYMIYLTARAHGYSRLIKK